MVERLCVFCEHIQMDTFGCHGDYPEPATFECRKGHWCGITEHSFPEGFRKQILVADKCPDYAPPVVREGEDGGYIFAGPRGKALADKIRGGE